MQKYQKVLSTFLVMGMLLFTGCTQSPDPQISQDGNIKIAFPKAGSVVTTPFTVSGEARSFDEVISLQVVRDGNDVITQTSAVTEEVKLGEFGKFSAEIDLKTAGEKVVLRVFSTSAKDGREVHLIELPIEIKN